MMAEEPNQTAPEEEAPTKKPGLVLPLIIAVVAAAVGGALGVTLLGPAVAPSLAARAQSTEAPSKGGGHGATASGPAKTLHILENLVVNPAGSEGTRYLLVSVAIEPTDQGMIEDLAAMEVAFRHTLLTTFGAKTVAELSDISMRQQIVEELQDSLESLMGEGIIHRIYLPQYVIQ
jgi:flagellar FliL protein